MTPRRFSAVGFPWRPSIRIRLLAGVPVASGEALEADRGVDVVAQHGFGGGKVAVEHGLHRFLQQRLPKRGVGLDAGLDQIVEAAGERHYALVLQFGRAGLRDL